MKRYIKFTSSIETIWYRAVPEGENPLEFNYYNLGIHCGSLDQAKYITSLHKAKYDIYKIILKPEVIYSKNIKDDFEDWSSAESIACILTDGFNIFITRSEVSDDRKAGLWSKDINSDNFAAKYIINKVGISNIVVKYPNKIELPEEDIIILDSLSIEQYIKIS